VLGLGLALATTLVTSHGQARAGGIAASGCTGCHSGGPQGTLGMAASPSRFDPGARVELTVGADVRATPSSEDGAFGFDPPEGAATVRIEAPGFAPQTLEGRIPHRGEWAPLEVRLVPLRAELLRRYGVALATIVPPHEKLGLRTPRELALLALRHRPSLDPNALRALRGWVEVACFGADAPPPDALDRLGKLVHDLGA